MQKLINLIVWEREREELKGMTMGLYFKNYISFGPVVYS